MNRLINELNYNKSNIVESLHEAKRLQTKLKEEDSDFTFGMLVTTTTRVKLLTDIVDILKDMRHYKTQQVTNKVPKIVKRIKLHTYQLSMLDSDDAEKNEDFFKDILKLIFTWNTMILKMEKMKLLNMLSK